MQNSHGFSQGVFLSHVVSHVFHRFFTGLHPIVKSRGPRTDPCGTPDSSISLLDLFLGPISVICLRPIRYEVNQSFIMPRIL